MSGHENELCPHDCHTSRRLKCSRATMNGFNKRIVSRFTPQSDHNPHNNMAWGAGNSTSAARCSRDPLACVQHEALDRLQKDAVSARK